MSLCFDCTHLKNRSGLAFELGWRYCKERIKGGTVWITKGYKHCQSFIVAGDNKE